MDIAATVLASIIILLVPVLLWLRYRARDRYEHDLVEIKNLVVERSEWLNKLNSHLDALDEKESEDEPVVSEDATVAKLRLLARLLPYQTATGQDAALEMYWATFKAPDIEVLNSGNVYMHSAKLYRFWSEESTTAPEWFRNEDLHSKGGRRRRTLRPLRSSTLQSL